MTVIIAEFGSNPAYYNWNTAADCEYAARSGATHCKIQLFKADHFPAAEQESKRALEFPRQRAMEFSYNAARCGLVPGASVFDAEATEIVTKWDGLYFIKLAAREQNNALLIGSVASAQDIHSFGVFRSICDLSDERITMGDEVVKNWTHLYAVQRYPAGMYESIYWLWRSSNFFRRYGIRWGWSSHTRGTQDCILAARWGASVIEKHFCLHHSDVEGGYSLTPREFAVMAEGIRRWE